MARRRRFLIGSVFIVGLLIALAVVAAPLVPLTAFEPAVENRLSAMLGRRVTIDSMRLNLLGSSHFTIKGMTVQEDTAFGEGEFLRADDVRAHIDLVKYLRERRVAIDELTVKSAQIHLVRNPEGAWNWTTLGTTASGPGASLSDSKVINSFLLATLSPSSLRKIRIENASVRMTDRRTADSPESLYKNIGLNASFDPVNQAGSEISSRVAGEFTAESEEDGESEVFKATFPFDFSIERSSAKLIVNGSVGPGPLETKNLILGSFSVNGQILAEGNTALAGTGRLSASQMLIRPINLSQQMATALRIPQIGDMNPGTSVGELESEFHLSQGAVETSGLMIREIDGLGDAVAQTGCFRIDSELSLTYPATVTLSDDATSRIKSAGTMLGIITTVFEVNNRISVPVNIDGDVRNPHVYIDVSRIF